jgi:hypothetical protein
MNLLETRFAGMAPLAGCFPHNDRRRVVDVSPGLPKNMVGPCRRRLEFPVEPGRFGFK